jgi:O-antigen/teichoic acid export membrane protein
MVPAVKILSLFGVVRSLGATVGPILYSTGRPSIQAKLSGIQLLFMALIIYPLITRWDITGASWAILLPNILALFMIIGESQKIVLFRYGEILKIILVPAIAVLAMLTVLLFIQLRCIPSKVGTIYFFASGISGAVVYLAFVFIGDKWTGHTLRRDLKAIAAICGS